MCRIQSARIGIRAGYRSDHQRSSLVLSPAVPTPWRESGGMQREDAIQSLRLFRGGIDNQESGHATTATLGVPKRDPWQKKSSAPGGEFGSEPLLPTGPPWGYSTGIILGLCDLASGRRLAGLPSRAFRTSLTKACPPDSDGPAGIRTSTEGGRHRRDCMLLVHMLEGSWLSLAVTRQPWMEDPQVVKRD